jgi:hypothetical protein
MPLLLWHGVSDPAVEPAVNTLAIVIDTKALQENPFLSTPSDLVDLPQIGQTTSNRTGDVVDFVKIKSLVENSLYL